MQFPSIVRLWALGFLLLGACKQRTLFIAYDPSSSFSCHAQLGRYIGHSHRGDQVRVVVNAGDESKMDIRRAIHEAYGSDEIEIISLPQFAAAHTETCMESNSLALYVHAGTRDTCLSYASLFDHEGRLKEKEIRNAISHCCAAPVPPGRQMFTE